MKFYTTSLTKSESLKFIQKKLKPKIVPEFLFFSKKDYLNKKNYFLQKVKNKFNDDIIVRSSATDEDSKYLSNAGKYESFKVKKKNFDSLDEIINKLISKFNSNKDQILIQKFINNPNISGVVFTKDKNTDSHYYQINYEIKRLTNFDN